MDFFPCGISSQVFDEAGGVIVFTELTRGIGFLCSIFLTNGFHSITVECRGGKCRSPLGRSCIRRGVGSECPRFIVKFAAVESLCTIPETDFELDFLTMERPRVGSVLTADGRKDMVPKGKGKTNF